MPIGIIIGEIEPEHESNLFGENAYCGAVSPSPCITISLEDAVVPIGDAIGSCVKEDGVTITPEGPKIIVTCSLSADESEETEFVISWEDGEGEMAKVETGPSVPVAVSLVVPVAVSLVVPVAVSLVVPVAVSLVVPVAVSLVVPVAVSLVVPVAVSLVVPVAVSLVVPVAVSLVVPVAVSLVAVAGVW